MPDFVPQSPPKAFFARPVTTFILATAMSSTVASVACLLLFSGRPGLSVGTVECHCETPAPAPTAPVAPAPEVLPLLSANRAVVAQTVADLPAPEVDERIDTPARAALPRVRQAEAEIKGGLDRDIVRRVVKGHLSEVRYCYNEGLARKPELAGRVTVQFKISTDGQVQAAVVQSSTLNDEEVEDCVTNAVQRWRFPAPRGGEAVVSYPFVLSPG